jgi:hypothetical protein
MGCEFGKNKRNKDVFWTFLAHFATVTVEAVYCNNWLMLSAA